MHKTCLYGRCTAAPALLATVPTKSPHSVTVSECGDCVSTVASSVVLTGKRLQANRCRSANVDNTMMVVMVGARVESDRARSVLDG